MTKEEIQSKYHGDMEKLKSKHDMEIKRLRDKLERDMETASVEEDSAGAITTGSVGSSTLTTGEPAPFGNSSIYAKKIGSGQTMSRRGAVGGKKKKKKKLYRDFVEEYFED